MLSPENQEWGIRLADVRLPRRWLLPAIVALLLIRRRQNRALQDVEKVGKDLGEIAAQRWREGDVRADRLIALTRTLTLLTWVLLAVTAVTLVVNVVILVSS